MNTKPFIFIVLLGLGLGGFAAFYLKPKWAEFRPVDRSFTAQFYEQRPVQIAFPKPDKYSFVLDDLVKVYSVKTPRGVDEINKFENINSPAADEDWFQATLRETKAQLLSGNKDDFTAQLPEGVFLRGRFLIAPEGKGLYKIFVIRSSEDELLLPSSVRFLYGIKFEPGD